LARVSPLHGGFYIKKPAMAFTAVLSLSACFASAWAADPTPIQFSFRGSGQMKEEDIQQALVFERTSGGERLAHFEQELSDMFTSLPKDVDGLVGHQLVRYALHRYFLHRHGWFIRGLEPGNATWTPQRRPDGSLPPAFVKEWVPAHLQNAIEQKGGNHGMDLHDMATMAATLEDLVHKEVEIKLQMVYDVHSQAITDVLPRTQADEILSTYLMTFLLAGNLTATSRDHFMKKRYVFTKKYKGYDAVHEWFEGAVVDSLGVAQEADFKAVSKVVHSIGETFHTFNDDECNDLRSTLRQVESRKEGRVRLSSFWNLTRYTHWRFTEKAEYLKTLGALDDSDPKNPSVIIANYVMARPNCLEASNLYAICCRNTCEDLMSHLEREIGVDKAPPSRITELVAALPSETVQAPRELPSTLLSRLDQIAVHHNGEVPLHGRLFAQWMHHAFPRECPFPHQTGTINPQTADEWMRESGSSTQESEEEIHAHILNDACAINWEGNPECGQEETEIPWSPIEELLSVPHPAASPVTAEHEPEASAEVDAAKLVSGAFAIVCLAVVAASSVLAKVGGEQVRALLAPFTGKRKSLLIVLGSASLAYSVELLQGSVFVLALGGCFAMYLVSVASQRAKSSASGKGCMPIEACLPMHAKGV